MEHLLNDLSARLKTLVIALGLLALIFLTACGYQLRGSNLDVLQRSNVYVESRGADDLRSDVVQQLRYAEVRLVGDASEADYVVQLSNERFDRNILSVSPDTGKVEEYELSYAASVSVTGLGGEKLLTNEPISAVRDYAFDDGAVLGNFTQENRLQRDITRHAATSVLRMLEAVTR